MSSYKKDINHIQLVSMRKIFVKSAKKDTLAQQKVYNMKNERNLPVAF